MINTTKLKLQIVLVNIVTITLRVFFSSVLQYTYLLTPAFIQTYSYTFKKQSGAFFLESCVFLMCNMFIIPLFSCVNKTGHPGRAR